MQMLESVEDTEVASLPFKIKKDRNGVEHMVIDFNDESLMPRTGQIMFEATKRAQRVVSHGYKYAMVKDRTSGVLIGINTGIHQKSGDLTWLKINLSTLNTFDLSIRTDREKAIVLKYSSIVVGSPNLSPYEPHHLFRVHDSEKAAHNEIQRIQDGQRAVSIAMALYGEDLTNTARNLGIMPETSSLSMLTAAVMKAAQDKPKDFLALWENPNRELITILKRCLDTGVIRHTPLEGYTYEGRPMGHNEPMVLDFLQKYRDTATTLDMKSRDKLRQSEKAMMKAAPLKTTSDVEIENALLKKRLDELTNKMNEITAKTIQEDAAPEDPALIEELEKLKAEAIELDLGIKGAHHYKPTRESLDKFITKITEAKRQKSKT